MRAVLWLAVLVLLPMGIARAQVRTAGQVSGTVLDPSGKVIPGAQVTVSNSATRYKQTVKANASGGYVFPSLEPGTYEIEATATGFAKAVYNSVVVEAAQTTDVDIKMTIGAETQTITISAATQILKTTQNTLSSTLRPATIENLPLAGRDLLEFAQLAPGATSGGQQRYTTYDNLPNAAINITVNGTDDNFLRFRTASTGFFTAAPLREGAFQEVTVSTNDLTADAGAEGSSQIRFVTQRGTDQFHGRAFWQTVNSFFNANSFTNNARGVPLPKTRTNYYGGNLGGPLLPKFLVGNHKTYFFVNLEYASTPISYVTGINQLTGTTAGGPTADNCGTSGEGAANGCYTYDVTSMPTGAQLAATPWVTGCNPAAQTCTANLFALASHFGVNNNTADSTVGGLLSQVAGYQKNGTLVPLSTSLTGPGSLYSLNEQYLQSLEWPVLIPYKNWYPTTRLDVDITQKIHWSDSWDVYWRNIDNTPNYPGSKFAGDGFKSTYYTWANNVTWQITPTLINTASFGITSDVEEFNPGALTKPWGTGPGSGQGDRVINFPFGVPTVVPGFIIPQPRNNPIFNPSDMLQWARGNHTLSFGGDVRYANMWQLTTNDPLAYDMGIAGTDSLGQSAFGSLTNFPNMSTANANRDLNGAGQLYSWLTGRLDDVSGGGKVNISTGQFAPETGWREQEAQTVGGAYFQDSWRTTPHLTLNYGLRWQISGSVHNNNNSAFNPTYANLLGPSTALFQPGTLNGVQTPQVTLRPYLYSSDWKQPAPNFGFAWNPDVEGGFLGKLLGHDRTVLRGGTSVSWYDEGWITFESAVFGNPGSSSVYNYFPGLPNFTAGQEFLSDPGVQTRTLATQFPSSYQTTLPQSEFTFSSGFGTIDPNIKPAYVEQWNFGIQRQLRGGTVIEVNYVGNHAVHVWETFNLNEINTTSNGFVTDFKNAQLNLAANAAGGCGHTFADNTHCAVASTPIFDAAFTGNGITTGATNRSGYANSGFLFDLGTGQAGAMASSLAGSRQYLCNMVGAGFSPCGNAGGSYPINFFEVNPYSAGRNLTYLSDPASSTYNALQISISHPTGHGLMLGANYTFSKSLTGRWDGSNDSAFVNFTSLRDMGLNKAPSAYDIRHVFHAYLNYALPFGRGRTFAVNNSVLNAIVGGWNVGTIVVAQSGRPFWLQGGYNTYNNVDGGVVLNGITRSQLQNNVGVYTTSNRFAPVDWLNPSLVASSISASVVQPEQTPGAIGQNLFLYGPMFVNTDISLNKTFPIHERLALVIQASFLNAFNHADWTVGGSAPGVNFFADGFTSPQVATLGNNPRVIQWRTQLTF